MKVTQAPYKQERFSANFLTPGRVYARMPATGEEVRELFLAVAPLEVFGDTTLRAVGLTSTTWVDSDDENNYYVEVQAELTWRHL